MHLVGDSPIPCPQVTGSKLSVYEGLEVIPYVLLQVNV